MPPTKRGRKTTPLSPYGRSNEIQALSLECAYSVLKGKMKPETSRLMAEHLRGATAHVNAQIAHERAQVSMARVQLELVKLSRRTGAQYDLPVPEFGNGPGQTGLLSGVTMQQVVPSRKRRKKRSTVNATEPPSPSMKG